MGDLAADTAVEGRDGRYRAHLSDSWAAWGPFGGYVSAIALRAAGARSRLSRPTSFACHYLSVADFRAVDLEVTVLRSAKRAESLRVSMTQDGAPVLEALVWTTAESDGLEHDHAAAPAVPAPETLKSWEELYPDERPPYSFWENIEARPIDSTARWLDRTPGDPVYRHWFRFRPRPAFDDPFVDAARLVMLLDVLPWPAAAAAYTGPMPYIAPSLDLTVRFHRAAPQSEWLLGVGDSPIAQDGLVSGGARVWSHDGRLLASGEQHMICRPTPGHLVG